MEMSDIEYQDMLRQYKSILYLSANEPEELRPSDIDRVMDAAKDQNCQVGFRGWLLKQALKKRTRELVEDYFEEDQ